MKTTLLLAIVISAGAAFANAQCVRDGLEVYGIVKGQVVEDRANGEPIRGSSVSVSEDKYEGKLIASTTTDEHGNFTLPRVKLGKYSIAFRYPNFDPIITRLRVLRSKSNQSFIKARIAPPDPAGSDSCEGDAEVIR